GGAGNDIMIGGTGNDTLLGGDGNDSFSYTFGDGVDTYSGGLGVDALSITGTTGNDALTVTFDGTSITSFTGGSVSGIETFSADLAGGTDTLSHARTTVGISVDLTAHTASGFTSILGVENVTGGSGNDTLTGDAAANALAGGAGDDTYFVGAGDTVTEGAAAGTDTVNSSVTFTLGANVENLTLTGIDAINGTGNGLANVLIGNSAANVLSGPVGNDPLDGGDATPGAGGGAGPAGADGGHERPTRVLCFASLARGTSYAVFVFGPRLGNDVLTDFHATPPRAQDLPPLSAFAPDIAANFAAPA